MRASTGGHGSHFAESARCAIQAFTRFPNEENTTSEFTKARGTAPSRHRYHKTKEGITCMDRRPITAAVAEEADRLLAQGEDHFTIATRLKITEYVVGLMAENRENDDQRPPATSAQRFPNCHNFVDAVTVRRIQRMLDVSWLNHSQIAREVGVSPNFVTEVAQGERLPISTERPVLDKGERFLQAPIRCSVCRALVSIVPCRACRTRRARGVDSLLR